MTNTDITEQMYELYRKGMTLEEVGSKFSMTRQAVRSRFVTAGLKRRKRDKCTSIDKELLQTLYHKKRLRVPDIALLLSVSTKTIKSALKFHQISKREQLKKGGYIVDFLRSLKINERNIIEWRRNNKEEYAHLHSTTKLVGIKISIKALGNQKFQITRYE